MRLAQTSIRRCNDPVEARFDPAGRGFRYPRGRSRSIDEGALFDAETLGDTWAEVVRTAALVRAQCEPLAADAGSPWRAWRPAIGVAAVASALFFAFAHGETSAVVAAADGSADVRLFSLTN